MAAMMPSAETSSHNPYDNDAVERDLIDPDDGRCRYVDEVMDTCRLTINSYSR
jgi:hypothetical protein